MVDVHHLVIRFQPYERTPYSVGAVYLVCLNLPPEARYEEENMILVCVLPGGSEKAQDLNNLLEPMVDELLCLWKGTRFSTPDHPDGVKVRAALHIISCDLPGGRKVCGFASASRRCSRCTMQFDYYDTGIQKKVKSGARLVGHATVMRWDYSGPHADSKDRTKAEVDRLERQYQQLKTKTARQAFFSQNGVKRSILSKLPYFDRVTNLVVPHTLPCLLFVVFAVNCACEYSESSTRQMFSFTHEG